MCEIHANRPAEVTAFAKCKHSLACVAGALFVARPLTTHMCKHVLPRDSHTNSLVEVVRVACFAFSPCSSLVVGREKFRCLLNCIASSAGACTLESRG